MKIIVSQCVKLDGDKCPHNWKKEYDSTIIPRVGDYIEDPIWKDPYEYKVTRVIINYDIDQCYVNVDSHNRDIPSERKEEFADMANGHGWKPSWRIE